MAYRLLAKDTIEEKIQRLQMAKNLMSTDVLGETGFARALDQSDLEYLFELKDQEAE
jgi:SNF2 family DNA or RNA helicase